MGDLILIPGLRSVVKWSHLCTSSPIVPNFHLTELKTSTGSYILTASWLTRSRAAPAVFLLLPTGHVQNRNVQLDPINGSKRSIDGAIGKFLKGFSATSLSLRSLPSSQRQVFRRNLEWLLPSSSGIMGRGQAVGGRVKLLVWWLFVCGFLTVVHK